MAIEYHFNMVAPLAPRQAMELLVNEVGFEWGSEQPKAPQIGGYGLWIYAIPTLGLTRTSYEEKFGFCPILSVWFRFQTSDYDTAVKTMMRSVMLLLSHDTGNAVLESIVGPITLQRIGGELLIDTAYHNPRSLELFLSEVTLPYKLCELPQPFMGDDLEAVES